MEYRIRVKGHLDPSWQTWFLPLQITHEPEGSTCLSGALPDQPALVQVVLKLHHLGITLMSFERAEHTAYGEEN